MRKTAFFLLLIGMALSGYAKVTYEGIFYDDIEVYTTKSGWKSLSYKNITFSIKILSEASYEEEISHNFATYFDKCNLESVNYEDGYNSFNFGWNEQRNQNE